jgi:hypothetical protein
MVEGLWHRVIKAKYLSSLSVEHWLRMVPTPGMSGSQTWKYLLKSLYILLHWMAWYPGFGNFDCYWERPNSWFGRIDSFV